MAQQQQIQHQIQQTRTGECNILPRLLDHLHSTLELWCSNNNSDEPLLFEDSSANSKENFRLWINQFDSTSIKIKQKSNFNISFVENILLDDIHRGLHTLQDLLKRVDICTLTKYNATLNPQSKLYLIRLISNLLRKLKIPENANLKLSESESKFYIGSWHNENDRYTINVFPQEINQTVRQWLSEKPMNLKKSSVKIEFEKKKKIADTEFNSIAKFNKVTNQTLLDKSLNKTLITDDKNTVNDMCIEDIINKQQLHEKKNNCDLQKRCKKTYDSLESVVMSPRSFNSLYKDKDDIVVKIQKKNVSHYHHLTTPTRYNKIIAKKSKIKRANTIDIPNFVQIKSKNSDQITNGYFALKRPIDVGDKIINGYKKVIPFFKPKTENDRKFLALINKNTDTIKINSISPFKCFNYHSEVLMADKTWSDRFLNIKTNFDKLQKDEATELKKPDELSIRKKFENIKNINSEKDKLIIGSAKELHEITKQKQNSFTHAPTSFFQKIDKPSSEIKAVPLLLKSKYTPKNNMFEDKLKMFDRETSKSYVHNNNTYLQSQIKIKFNKSFENKFHNSHSIKNDYLSCYPFGKQCKAFDNERKDLFNKKSNIKSTKFKLLFNFNKNLEKSEMKKEKPKILYPKTDDYFLHSSVDKKINFLNQYSYCNSVESNPINPYQNKINQERLQNYIKPKKFTKNHDILSKNVADQTMNECINKKLSKSEFKTSIENLFENDPKMQSRKLHNVSIQISPNVSSIMQYTNPNYTQNLTNSNNILPTSNIHKMYDHQSLLSEITNIPNSTTHQYIDLPSHSVHSNYNNSNNNHRESNNSIYKKIPYRQQSYSNFMVTDALSSRCSTKQLHFKISKKLYNEFNKLPEKQIAKHYFIQNDSKLNNAINNTVSISCNNPKVYHELIPSKSTISVSKDKQMSDLTKKNIQNRISSSDGIITHCTCTVGTVSSSMLKSPEQTSQIQSQQNSLPPKNEFLLQRTKKKITCNTTLNEIQDNVLQQSQTQYKQQTNNKIIPRQLPKELVHEIKRSSVNQICYNDIHPEQLCVSNAKNKAQEKIYLFEDKSQQIFQKLNISPKINMVNSTSEQCNQYLPIRNKMCPTDSSGKYLMSCANKSTKNIVLSKSQSWHQLGIAKNTGNLRLPRSLNSIQLRPPKSKTSFALKLSKQFEASSISDNMRKMQEKIQRYFQDSISNSHANELKQINGQGSKSKYNIQFKNNIYSLSRSHTMPRLNDEKLFDDNTNIDKIFDKIFQEATRSDKRY